MVQRSSTVTFFCYVHLRRNRFQLLVPLPERLIVIALLSEVMTETRRKLPRVILPPLELCRNRRLPHIQLEDLDKTLSLAYLVRVSTKQG